MPSFSFPLPSGNNDPGERFTALLKCEKCGRYVDSLRAIGDAMSRMFVCKTCYEQEPLQEVALADWPELPDTEDFPTVILPVTAAPAVPPVPEEELLLAAAIAIADQRDDCTPEPNVGEYCAAAYLAYLEASGMSFVPDGEAVLCTAHWQAVLDDCIERYPSLRCQPWKLPEFARFAGDLYIRSAAVVAAHVAMRQGR